MSNKRDIIKDYLNQRETRRGRYKGQIYGKDGHIFYRGDVLYSYGQHFPLLIRHKWGYLLNADKYSVTTSKHQGYCRNAATIQIPLSALRSAGIDYRNFNLIDKGKERDDLLGYKKTELNPDAKTLTLDEYEKLEWHKQRGWHPDNWEHPTKYYWAANQFKATTISIKQFEDMPESKKFGKERPMFLGYEIITEKDGQSQHYKYNGITEASSEWTPKTERRPEYDVIESKGIYFLSGMDNNRYFLCQLPEPAKTVDKALEQLVPNELRLGRGLGVADNVKRQGEWFFQPHSTPDFKNADKELRKKIRVLYNEMQKDFTLPRTQGSNPHKATRGILKDGFVYVTGTIHHPEHKALKLSTTDAPIIYQAFCNRAVASYSASGNVD